MSSFTARFTRGLGAASACWLGLTLSAPVDAQTQPAKEKAGESAIAVEGCLTKEGPAGTSSAAEQFVLVLPAPDRTSGTATTGAAEPAPPLPKMYALRSAETSPIAFASFVNQRVKVAGTTTAGATSAPLAGRSPEATPYPAPAAAGSTAPGGATGTPFDRANLPTIVVSSMTSVAKTCRP